jgi:integrase
MLVDNPRAEPCAICGDSGPAISYFWPGGLMVGSIPVKVGPHGKLSGAFSKRWRRFTACVGVDSPQKVFHRLRHLVTDKLRASGTQQRIISAILGHTTPGMTSRYGNGWDVQALHEAVAFIKY